MVRLAEEQTWGHVAWDEREVGTVVTIKDLLRTSSTHHGHKRVVVVGMTAVEPVGHAVDLILRDDIREVDVGIIDGDTEVKHHVHTSPVTQADGHAVGVLGVEGVDVFVEALDGGTQLLLVGLVLHGDRVEHGLQIASHIADTTAQPVIISLSLSVTTIGTLRQQILCLLTQTDCLFLSPVSQLVVVASEHTGCRGEDTCRLKVEPRITVGEGPHVIRGT